MEARGRTNFVLFDDLVGLRKALEPFSVEVVAHDDALHHMIKSTCPDGGGWPGSATVEMAGGVVHDVEFSFEESVAPFMKPGQTLVAMEVCADKLRTLTGWAGAFHWDGKSVDCAATLADLRAGVGRLRGARVFDRAR